MSRLIDADAIKLEKGFFENIDNVPKFFEWLGKQPTVDPAKHGRWIPDRLVTTNGSTYGVRRCSLCEAYYQDVGYGFHYCPNCGARMEGEEDE